MERVYSILKEHCGINFFRASTLMLIWELKPGFHIVVSVVSVVRKKFIGQIQLYGNLRYKCSIQQKREIQLVVRDRMNSICRMNFFRTTDTTIWKPGLNKVLRKFNSCFDLSLSYSSMSQ